ncbi:long-chain-fatty-acid--CoA ligase 1-like [Ptychodera flava]|uniref:long-chain-fatty-acid--CoA ligase 1-like n=1 Tax=Ptychodera flava TaxID=63121 RepID=UPI003969C136
MIDFRAKMADAMNLLSDHSTLVGLGLVAGTTALWMLTRPKPVKMQIDPNKQSIELPGKERIHVYPTVADGKLVEYKYEDVRTAHDAFMRGRRLSGDKPCYGWRPGPDQPYQWMTYNETYDVAKNIGSGLVHIGCKPQADTFIGIYASNRLEWGLTEQACMMYSMVLVPLYDTLGPDACSFIIGQAEIANVVCDTAAKTKLLLGKAKETSCMKRIIMIEDITAEVREEAEKHGVEVIQLSEIENIGKDHPHELVPPKPDDLFTVCYTSGTTGNPKGAMLTHGNMVATFSAFMDVIEPYVNFDENGSHISYLPLAHGYERLCHVLALVHGAGIGFYQGDVRKILDDCRDVKPMAFPSVPRLYNRIYDKIISGVQSSFIKKTLFNLAYKSKQAELKRGVVRQDSIWDKLIFSRIQSLLGGRVQCMFNGAAPISDETMEFLRVVFGTHVLNGYGQTESGVASTLTLPGDHTTGHVGPPLPCNMIKLVDVAEMEYFASNNQGEICFKGYNIFQGYLNDPEKTKEALDEDGWLHSGDIGEWLPNGTLKLIDRKKHIFKLAQGEYLAPERIESIYVRCPLVLQAYVHGDSFKSYAVGIVVPDPDELLKWAKENGMSGSLEELCRNTTVKKTILDQMHQAGKESGLKSFEQVKDIYLSAEQFTMENDLLTPTSKSKRPSLRKHFAEQIQAMYE